MLLMASQACFGRSAIDIVQIDRSVWSQWVALKPRLRSLETLLMFVSYLFLPLRLLELGERFSVAPGEGGAVLDRILLILFGLFERLWVSLTQAHPLDLLLKKTKCAATAGPPAIIVWQAKTRTFENFDDAGLVNTAVLEW